MDILNKIRQHLPSYLSSLLETDAKDAYDVWATNYDQQPDNLMLALDEAVFGKLIEPINFHNKIVADIGCGTGRHWEKIYAKQPQNIVGYDVSEGMLKILKKKFSHAETHTLVTNHLDGLKNNSCDILVSTLAIAHIKNIDDAFTEWDRILNKDGQIIITDYHPDALSKGGNRTFTHNGKQIAIKNNIHPVKRIEKILTGLGFKMEVFIERKIDETVKHYYEKQLALKTFDKFKGTSIIYGAHFIRRNAA